MAAAAALVGFAANSILCRGALGSRSIDPCSFTVLRIGSGAATLFLLSGIGPGARSAARSGSPLSAAALFAYAAAFSLAYVRLPTGVGALVLFACVQATMIAAGIRRGERPTRIEWAGIAVALTGLAILARPGVSLPDPVGLVLMAAAGVAWGVYSLRGRGSHAPLLATAGNFLLAVPLAIGMLAVGAGTSMIYANPGGVWFALASGALASGLGYTCWYLALPGLDTVRAAVLQLAVPVIAAAGGILLLGEAMTSRLTISGTMILGGVGAAVIVSGREKP